MARKIRSLTLLGILGVCLHSQWSFVNFHLPTWKQQGPWQMARRAVEVSPEWVEDLELGKSYVGKVLEVNEFGATLDLGLDNPGWLHKSHMEMLEGMQNPKEVLKKDDELTVRVKKVHGCNVDLTMLDLPQFQKKTLSEYKRGDVLGGRVTQVSPKWGLFVDVGAMVEGFMPKVNLKGARLAHFQEGQEVQVKVETVTKHKIILALGRAEELEVGSSFTGKVLEVNEFGATVDLGLNMPGWLHKSHMEMPEGSENPKEVLKMDDELTVRVKQVKRSQVDLTMLDDPDFQKKPLSSFQEGDELEGRVKTIRPQAIFLDVGAMVDGTLPEKFLKGIRPAQFQLGQEVKVKVETVTNNKIILALEEVDGLLGAAEDLEIGKSIVGKVMEVNEFGATLDLGLDKPGWLHKSHLEMPEGIENPIEVLKKDDELTARVKRVQGRSVDLTMLDLPEFRKKPLSGYKKGDVSGARVTKVSPKLGLFVDVGAMVEGLLPTKKLKGLEPSQFQQGQEVNVEVEKVTNNKIILALSI